jgi:hypothetical protein
MEGERKKKEKRQKLRTRFSQKLQKLILFFPTQLTYTHFQFSIDILTLPKKNVISGRRKRKKYFLQIENIYLMEEKPCKCKT